MTTYQARPCKLRHSLIWGASVPNLIVKQGDDLVVTTRNGKSFPAIVTAIIHRGTDSTIVSVLNTTPPSSTGVSHVSMRPRLTSPALKDPNDPAWGLCPHCKQSAQTRINGLLSCYRCDWTEAKPRSIFTTQLAVPAK